LFGHGSVVGRWAEKMKNRERYLDWPGDNMVFTKILPSPSAFAVLLQAVSRPDLSQSQEGSVSQPGVKLINPWSSQQSAVTSYKCLCYIHLHFLLTDSTASASGLRTASDKPGQDPGRPSGHRAPADTERFASF